MTEETRETRFLAFMRSKGFDPGTDIIADGEYHRFSRKCDNPRDDAGYYRLSKSPEERGEFGCWRTEEKYKWTDSALALDAPIPESALSRDARPDMAEATALEANRLWESADEVEKHPYLDQKLVGAYGLKVEGQALLVPARDELGILHSLHRILPDGSKRNLKDGRMDGCFHLIGKVDGKTICVAEGYATAASIHEVTGYPVVAALSLSNLKAAATAMRRLHPSARIILCADDDYLRNNNPGVTGAKKAALTVDGLIAIPQFGPGRPQKATDFNDLRNLEGDTAVLDAIKSAQDPQGELGEMGGKQESEALDDGRTPGDLSPETEQERTTKAIEEAERRLFGVLDRLPDYPTESLGPLEMTCREISREGQLPIAMVGQCLLATASLLAQSRANVWTPGGSKPLSLYLLTIAESAEGKSTAEWIALNPVKHYEKQAHIAYLDDVAEYEQEKQDRKKGDPIPEKPPHPYRTMKDTTIEGVRKSFTEGPISQAIFTAEAATILTGYGMSAENRMKTASGFNQLWDDGDIAVSRVVEGRSQFYGARLTIHWQIQSTAAFTSVNDTSLTDIGLWPRFLTAVVPPSPPRAWREFDPAKNEIIGAYWKRCSELLEHPLPAECSDLPTLPLSDEALEIVKSMFEELETKSRTEQGHYRVIKVFACRATEQACRIAGILAIFNGTQQVEARHMLGAKALLEYNLNVWLSLLGEKASSEDVGNAMILYRWLLSRPGKRTNLQDISHVGPKRVRKATKRDAAIALLVQQGMVVRDDRQVIACW